MVTTYFSSKLMQPASGGAQSKQTSTMNIGMAVMMGFMSLNFAGALVLYWVVNNVLQVIQTLVINKMELGKTEITKKAI